MADQASSPAAVKPPFDPSPILDKLKGIVEDHKDPKGGGSSWLGTLIIIAVVLVSIAVWSWISFRRNAELAKLRHEREVQRIRAEKAVVAAQVAKNDAAAAAAQKQLDATTEQLKHIDGGIKAEEQRYAADLRAVDRIRSWRDVDPGAS